MENEEKNDLSETQQQRPYTFSDEGTKNKMKKHISDINDVITEQDIANVKVPGEDKPLPPHLPDLEYEKKDNDKDENLPEGKPITPWDVID